MNSRPPSPRPSVLILLALTLLLLAAPAARAQSERQQPQCPSGIVAAGAGGAEVTPRGARPLLMYVFGDSIMWGEGLADHNKFWCRTKQWLEAETGQAVNVRLFAHAGATVKRLDDFKRDDPDWFGDWRAENFGEINVSYPTVDEQIDAALSLHAAEAKGVDLVLVDGCANDVNFRNMLDVRNSQEDIRRLTTEKCGAPMKNLLAKVAANYSEAQIFVTGYYPFVFRGRPANAKNEDVPGTAYNLITRKAIKSLVKDLKREGKDARQEGAGTKGGGNGGATQDFSDKDSFRAHLEGLSQTWVKTSDSLLQNAADDLNAANRRRVHFVQINLPPDFAFSTAHTLLWNFRFGSTGLRGLSKAIVILLDGIRTFDPNDERQGVRAKVCKEAEKKLKEDYEKKKRDYRQAVGKGRPPTGAQKEELAALKKYADGFRQPCNYGSLGHPNRFGAALYAQAIISQLQVLLPDTGWLKADAAPGAATPR